MQAHDIFNFQRLELRRVGRMYLLATQKNKAASANPPVLDLRRSLFVRAIAHKPSETKS